MNIDGYCTLGVDREYDLTACALLEQMDYAEVDRAVIAPVDRCLAVNNHKGNVLIRDEAAKHPDRFIPSCCANPWRGAEAVDELKGRLDEGARLFVLHPAVQGFLANDELVWPLLAVAEEKRVPVYIHTGPPGSATPWQLVDLAERFPELDLIMGHSGATDFWNDAAGAAGAVPNIYLESSLARPFVFMNHLEKVGSEKCIMGSFAPVNDFEFEWEQMRAALSPSAAAGVCGENLKGLLEKRGPL